MASARIEDKAADDPWVSVRSNVRFVTEVM